jgi:hypothetical protein
MSSLNESYDGTLEDLIDRFSKEDMTSEAATTAVKNLKTFAEVRAMLPEPEPEPESVPSTKLEKVKAGVASALDNETTRVLIKAGGAFAGVALVAWTTIHRDHVMERQALAQANQRSV